MDKSEDPILRIGLETTWINVLDGGGRYTNEIVRYLCTLYPEHQFFTIGPGPKQNHDYPNLTHISFPDTVGLPARFYFTVRTASILRELSLDLYHILVNFGIYNSPCPVVTTVHDLLTLKYPELRSKKIHGWLYKYYIPGLIKKADFVISDSESTTCDLGELYGIRNNIATVPLGYNRDLFSPESSDDEHVMNLYGLQPGYLLFVGNLIPKKNVEVIIRALHLVREKGKTETKLVLVGKRGHGSEKLFQLIESLSLKENVLELGYVPDEHIGALYRQAFLFLFASRFEGFGLPVIEAMACGTPALVSDTGPLPELLENDKYTCSPGSPEKWAEKIAHLMEDKQFYMETRAWCLQQAHKFSWENCVREYMKIYVSVVRKTS